VFSSFLTPLPPISSTGLCKIQASGISPSVALELNIYSPNGVGMAWRTNGQTGPPYRSTAPVNLAGGNPIGVLLSYDGTTLSTTLTDMVTHATFMTKRSFPCKPGQDSIAWQRVSTKGTAADSILPVAPSESLPRSATVAASYRRCRRSRRE
jgi:hypothetical protein